MSDEICLLTGHQLGYCGCCAPASEEPCAHPMSARNKKRFTVGGKTEVWDSCRLCGSYVNGARVHTWVLNSDGGRS